MQSSTAIKNLFVLGNSSSLVEDKSVRLPPGKKKKKCGLYSAAGKPRESIDQLATRTKLWNLVSFKIRLDALW